MAFDCIVHQFSGSTHLSVMRILVQIFVPFAVLLLFSIAWAAVYYLKHLQAPMQFDWLQKRLLLTSFSVLGYFYPSLTQAALNIFACFPLDSPVDQDTLYRDNLRVSYAAAFTEKLAECLPSV